MTTTPNSPLQFVKGSTLNPVEVEVASFPLDPTAEGTVIAFQASYGWTDELVLDDVAVEVLGALEVGDGRWSFTLSVPALDTTNLAPGPYYGAFRIEPLTGGVAFVPASARLLIEVLKAPAVAP